MNNYKKLIDKFSFKTGIYYYLVIMIIAQVL